MLANSFSKISSTLRSSGWRCIVLAGSGPSILIFCQRSPCLGRSKSQASSNIVIPRLKTSHALVNRPCNVSGARYLRRIIVKRSKRKIEGRVTWNRPPWPVSSHQRLIGRAWGQSRRPCRCRPSRWRCSPAWCPCGCGCARAGAATPAASPPGRTTQWSGG